MSCRIDASTASQVCHDRVFYDAIWSHCVHSWSQLSHKRATSLTLAIREWVRLDGIWGMYSKIATWKKHDEPSKSSNPTIKSRVPMGTPSWTKKNGVTPQLQIVRKAGEVHRPTWVWNNIARVVLLFAWHQEIYVHFGCGLKMLKVFI